jgi:hypothetical protein
MNETKTHVGFVVVCVASAGQADSFGRTFQVADLEKLATKSGGLMWVIGDDLLTHQPLESSNKLKLDS